LRKGFSYHATRNPTFDVCLRERAAAFRILHDGFDFFLYNFYLEQFPDFNEIEFLRSPETRFRADSSVGNIP